MNENTKKIIELSDGTRSTAEIEKIVGVGRRYIGRVQQKMNLPRLKEGSQRGSKNHQFVSGRRIDLDGYVLVTAPEGYPAGRSRAGRKAKIVLEHRFLVETKIGRYLDPKEIVDHIDGLTLHNDIKNLRLFASNAEHLKETLSCKVPRWTEAGYRNIGTRSDRGREYLPVDTYRRCRATGDVRLRQILLAALSLGTESPFLLGTRRLLEKAQIDVSGRPSLERALADLYGRWEGVRTP